MNSNSPNPHLDRQMPSPKFLRSMLRFRGITGDPAERRLARALNIDDLRQIARRRVPRGPFEYVDGGADAQISARRNREAYDDLEFRPNALHDVSAIDTSVDLFFGKSAMPFGLGPTGFTRMLHAAGEIGVARAAGKHRVPYVLSSFGTTGYEQLFEAAPGAAPWFQLYLLRDRGRAAEVLDEISEAGCGTLVVTVDTPVSGRRLSDLRHGMTMPPSLTLKTVADAAIRPWWWWNLVTTAPLEFAYGDGTLDKSALTRMIDPTVTWGDVRWIRNSWDGHLVVKGIQSVADAEKSVECGADGIVLSNHGGRQLDKTKPPIRALPQVANAVADRTTVMIDSGFRHGSDIAAALALGAEFVFVGRPYLYGLMAGGEAGVEKCLELLADELRRTMALLGASSVHALTPEHVS